MTISEYVYLALVTPCTMVAPTSTKDAVVPSSLRMLPSNETEEFV
jgi:hypothetical protein